MFPLGAAPDYEPSRDAELPGAREAAPASRALEALYDHLAEGDGDNLIYFPIFNYNDGTLDAVRRACSSTRARSPA